ncbi:hypothetical protein WT26_11950 [Burkholderia cepacia]|uniref:Uncharacterized protein n=1 Tax=Burkholderia cepacia TaxID=292 RepID=A0A1B4PRU3_BURCE|nr:hypothetical protein WT26_11950 [Burkholderia cepacia]
MPAPLGKLTRGGFSVGIELPLDNDWSLASDAGVRHIGLHFRRNRRQLDETMAEIASDVLPAFHAQADASVA